MVFSLLRLGSHPKSAKPNITNVVVVASVLADSTLPRKILVAVEGSEPSTKAARYALKLAAASGAELAGICVVQLPEYIEENTRSLLRGELSGRAEKTLSEVERLASDSKVKFIAKTLETSGSIATAICVFAEREGFDLIVLGTRTSTSSLTKMMLGSVASGVASNASCPVLVVR